MYLKLLKAFVLKRTSLFLLIIFSISISLAWYIVNNNLIGNIQQLIWEESKPVLGGDIVIDFHENINKEANQFLEWLSTNWEIILSNKTSTLTSIEDNIWKIWLLSLTFVDNHFPLYWNFEYDEINNQWNTYISEDIQNKYVKNWKIELYGKEFVIKWIITDAPWASLDFFTRGNKVYIENYNLQDLWLDLDSSLFENQSSIKILDENNFETILSSIKTNPLFSEYRITDYKKWWNNFEQLFWELGTFISYIVIISFILTILITFISVESFFLENKKNFSVLKIIWLKNRELISLNFLLFSVILIMSIFISYWISESAFYFIRQFELSKNFVISGQSVLKAWILWSIILLVSILLPIIKFILHSPLQWLKSNFLQVYHRYEILLEWWFITLWITLISYITFWNIIKALLYSLWIILFIVLFYFLIRFILKGIYKKSTFIKSRNFCLYDAIRNTIKPWNLSILIVFSFFITFTSFLFISIVSLNFFDRLNIDLKNDNNIFAINITTKDLKNIDETYKKELYSILKWRILDINGVNISDHVQKDWWESGRWWERRFTREFNMTDNSLEKLDILQWDKLLSGQVSVDEDFSKDLWISIWDTINFLILWLEKELTVANIRESQNNSIAPFFYFQLYKKDFEAYPKTYFLSTYIEQNKINQFKKDLLKGGWNNIYFIEVDKILAELRSISSKIFLVIQILFIYILTFCVISILISINFFKLFNTKKMKLYHILWSSKDYIYKNNFYEYTYLQTIWFLLSIIFASLWSYYVINLSGFIEFDIVNFFYSLSGISVLFIVIMLFLAWVYKRSAD